MSPEEKEEDEIPVPAERKEEVKDADEEPEEESKDSFPASDPPSW